MLLFEHDLSFLLQSVDRIIERNKDREINLVEIGVNKGETAEKIITQLVLKTAQFNYYGIDPIDYTERFKYVNFINKPSHLAIKDIPLSIDWLFIDGCHCSKCVIRDFVLYGSRLSPGGEICFHDASPSTQGRDPQNYEFMNEYHDVELAKKGIAVREVLDNIVRKYPLLELVQLSLNQERGGVEIFRRKENC